jgi:hypothetical protein
MKKLLINPTKEESKNLTMLSVPSLVVSLMEKVLRTTEANFKPMVTQDHHTKTFITNVSYKMIPIQDFSGKELNSMQDAVDFYNEIANKIYGKYWMVELLKNEIRLSKDTNFGVRTEDPDLVQYIQKRLADTDSNVNVWYNMPNSTSRHEETDKSDKKFNKNNKLNANKKESENV